VTLLVVAISVPEKGGESQPHKKAGVTSGNQRPSWGTDVRNLLKGEDGLPGAQAFAIEIGKILVRSGPTIPRLINCEKPAGPGLSPQPGFGFVLAGGDARADGFDEGRFAAALAKFVDRLFRDRFAEDDAHPAGFQEQASAPQGAL
jgi:hypothetical protein